MPQTPHSAGGYNKNFYQAKEELYSGLYYHDNNLASGSLEALIRHLLPTVDYYPDVSIIGLHDFWGKFSPRSLFDLAAYLVDPTRRTRKKSPARKDTASLLFWFEAAVVKLGMQLKKKKNQPPVSLSNMPLWSHLYYDLTHKKVVMTNPEKTAGGLPFLV